MGVQAVQLSTTGLIPNTSGLGKAINQQLPVPIFIETNDTLATVLVSGYLNHSRNSFGFPYSNHQMALVYTTDQGVTWLAVSVSGSDYSLVGTTDVSTIFQASVGSAAAPSYTFVGRTNTGMYSSAANTLDLAADGTRHVSIGGAILAVNYLLLQGSVASSPTLISALGTDSNIGIGLVPKGTGAVQGPVGAVATPGYAFTGDIDTGMWHSGANTLDFSTNALRALQLVAAPALSVNYVTITPSIATSPVLVSAAGTDSNIGIGLIPKGTGAVEGPVGAIATPGYSFTGDLDTGMWHSAANTIDFSTNALRALQIVAAPAVSVNYLTITPSIASSPLLVSAAGTDADITINLVPKGTGGVTVPTGAITATSGALVSGAAASGGQGSLILYSDTDANGSLRMLAVGNAGNFATTISDSASTGQAQVITIPNSGAATANFLLDTGSANILTMQQFVGLESIMLISVGTWTTTRIAQGNYAIRHTPGDETSIIGIDITPMLRATASKGFRLDSFDVIYAIAANALDAHTLTLNRVVYADNVAVSVTAVAITATLATAT